MTALWDIEPRRPKYMANIKRVRAVSDIHTDYNANMEWARTLEADPDCLLIVAGDVSHDTSIIRKTLQTLKRKFGVVSYTPGNHDLWIEHGVDNSIEKLASLIRLCDDVGVETGPVRIGDIGRGLWVTPLLSWHHQSFDTEPDIDPSCWGRIPSVEKLVADYRRARWPEPLSPRDESVARWVDGINDYLLGDRLSEFMNDGAPILTFSHFLPRIELNPEKRYMTYPTLNKAIGSIYVERRLRAMKSSFHIFGHTHFGWDAELAPETFVSSQSSLSSTEPFRYVRYVQSSLAYPKEWEYRSRSLSVGTMSEDGRFYPVSVWEQDQTGENNCSGFPGEPLGGYWSDRYFHVKRTPEIIDALPPWNADRFQRLEGGRIENYVRHNSTRFDKF